MNFVSANEDVGHNETLAITDQDLSLNQCNDLNDVSSSEQHNDEIESAQSDNVLSCQNDDDVLGAANSGSHINIKYRCLNDTIYIYDDICIEFNVTNDGSKDFDAGDLKVHHSTYYLRHDDFKGIVSNDWKLSELEEETDYSAYFENTRPLKVGETSTFYTNLRVHEYFYLGVYSDTPANRVSINLPLNKPDWDIYRETVNGDKFYVNDEIIFNITVVNNHFNNDGRIWKDVVVQDKFPHQLKLENCTLFNSKGESVNFNYTYDEHESLLISIPELVDNVTIQTKYKAIEPKHDINYPVVVQYNSRIVDSYNEPLTILSHLEIFKYPFTPQVVPGQIIPFVIIVNNTWDRNITNFHVSDKDHDHLIYDGFEGDGWVKTGDHTFEYVKDLAPGEMAYLFINFTVDPDIEIGDRPVYLTNEAVLFYEDQLMETVASVYVERLDRVIDMKKYPIKNTVELGENASFTIVLHKMYNMQFDDIEIVDWPLNGLEFVGCSAVDGEGNNLTVSYVMYDSKIIFKIHGFQDEAFLFTTFKTTEAGTLFNGACLGKLEHDDHFDAVASVNVIAPFKVEKTVVGDFDKIFVGDHIVFKVNVTNTNDFNLTNVVLNENFPVNLTYLSFDGENWIDCGNNVFKYDGNLTPGNSTVVNFIFQIENHHVEGILENHVTVSCDETRNVTTSTVFSVSLPHVSLKKKALTSEVSLGDNVTFSIRVSSGYGRQDFYNLDIVDIVPSGLELLGCYEIDNDGNRIPVRYTVNGSNVTIHISEINREKTIYTEFKAMQTGTWENIVVVPYDKTKISNAQVRVKSNLTLFKDMNGLKNVIQGDTVTFRIGLENNEEYNLTDIVVNEYLPEKFQFVSFTGNGNWKQLSNYSFKYLGNLTSGEKIYLYIECYIPGNISGVYTNTVTAKSNQTDMVTSSFRFDVVTQDLTLEKVALNSSVWVGDTVEFDILVHNALIKKSVPVWAPRPNSAKILKAPQYEDFDAYTYHVHHDVEIVDIIPDGLRFEGCYAIDDYGDETPIKYRIEGNKVIFTLSSLYRFATIKTKFTAIKPGNQLNIAIKDNHNSSDSVFVKFANMTVDKIANNQTVYTGDKISFTIVVRNTGNTNLSEVFVEDKNFTKGLIYDSYVNRTGSGWKYIDGKFVYDGILKVNESASFDVIFNTTKAGNFTNNVIAGSNNTENKTAKNTTEVIDPVTVKVVKMWDDDSNRDGVRPLNVTVQLLADGVVINSTVLNVSNNWKFTFSHLPVYNKNGDRIVYTVNESEVAGYDASIEGSVADGFVITNVHNPLKTEVNVTKVWNDAENQDGFRPVNVTVELFNDTGKVAEFVLNQSNDWKHSFNDLPVYCNGSVINYTVGEVNVGVAGYSSEVSNDTAYNWTVTNSYTPKVTDVNVSKVWSDNDNQDGVRPSEVTVILYADGVEVNRTTLNISNNWKGSFTDLPVYRNGNVIVYTVDELPVDNYTVNVTGGSGSFVLNNTHVPLVTQVNVSKVWSDNGNQDGVRPSEVTVVLFADGVKVDETTITESDNWKASFDNLPVYSKGKVIVYTVGELPVLNYTVNVTGSYGSFVLNNTHVPLVTKVNVSKVWSDNENQDGVRPSNVTVVLFADGVEVNKTTITESDDWKASFENIPVYSKGKVIVYTVGELSVLNYTANVTGANGLFVINNTHVPLLRNVSISKVWTDHDDQDGVRPTEITVILYADGVEVKRTVLNITNNWKCSYDNLPVYKNGKVITYTVGELPVDKYVAKITDVNGSFVLNNTHVSLVRNVTVSKVWSDNENQDGVRPAEIIVILYADGVKAGEATLNDTNGWKYTFEHLDVYHDHGHVINYTVGELPVDNYTADVTGENGSFVINNTHVPLVTQINVTKIWDDADDQDGVRPSEVTVILFGDGVEVNRTVLNVTGNWKYSFENLPVYADGKAITYTVGELPVDKYVTKITGADGSFVVRNIHISLVRNVTVSKIWSDNDNQDGMRPVNVTVKLLADGIEVEQVTFSQKDDWKYTFEYLPVYHEHGKLINYTVCELPVAAYTVKVTGENGSFVINNTHVPLVTQINVTKVWTDHDDQDGVRPSNVTVVLFADGVKVNETVLSQKDNWKYSFENLPVYADGKLITYTVGELPVDKYVARITGSNGSFVVDNAHVSLVRNVTVSKVWSDNENQDGVRPSEVIVILYADGVKVAEATLNETNGWKYTFEHLDVYHDHGHVINYTVGELPVAAYTVKVTGENGSFVINNTHVPLVTQINVSKVWTDHDDQDGVRPSEVTVILYADGVEVNRTVLNISNSWKTSFDNLPVNSKGNLISYTVGEVPVDKYVAKITGADGSFVINNTHVSLITSVNVSKVWSDNDNQDGVRPSEVTVVLFADGVKVAEATLNETNGWKYTFEHLDVYHNHGHVINYTVGEIEVANYTVSVTGGNGEFVINNTHVPAVTQINVSKVWSDNDNQDGVRPSEVTVILYADGEKVREAVLTEKEGWKVSFDNLPVYADGKAIKYSLGEVEVSNYTSSISEVSGNFVVKNTHVPLMTQITVSKVWNDNDNQDGLRPVDVTVILFADGVKINETTITENDNWKVSFDDLPVFSNGKAIKYSVGEVEVDNYTSSVLQTADGFEITNTHVHIYVPNMTVSKISKNKTVYVGKQAVFTIVVTNTGDCNLSDVFVVDNAPEGLKYSSFKGDKWSYDKNRFVYNDILKPEESASIDIIFDAVRSGNFTNVVVAGSNATDNKTSNNTTVVYTPGLKVEKITVSEGTVGEITSFKIIVTNTGDCVLGDVFVREMPGDGLVFDSYESDEWTYDGNLMFYLNGVLNPGESSEFTVFFITTKVGVLFNEVIAGSNVTQNVTANNTTEVPEIVVCPIPENSTDISTPLYHEKLVKTNVERATGNPILVLLMVLLFVCTSSIRQFKK